jgi:hypothetical protein
MCVHLVVIIFRTIKDDSLVEALKDERVLMHAQVQK